MSRKVYGEFWKDIGQTDPYFGVLTHPEYRSDRLDDEARNAFFATGQDHIERTMRIFKKVWPKKSLHFRNALDFGCGTGRLSLSLAPYADQVTGVDISPGMIAEAEANKKRLGIENVRFKQIAGSTGFLDEEYDYIHSVMVFQHIHPSDGMEILDYLLGCLSPGGMGLISFTYHTDVSETQKWRNYIGFSFPKVARWIGKLNDYAFPMFDYDLNQVFALLFKHDIRRTYNISGTTGNHRFVRLYIQKRPAPVQ